MTSLSPRPGSRLDWFALWETYDAEVAQIRESTGAYLYTYHIGSQARTLLEGLVEEFVSAREAALHNGL